MKVLSIDVGIKNLAFCLLDGKTAIDNFKINKWNIINLTQQNERKCCEETKNIICNKPAKFMKNDKCYCLKHSKKKEFQIPDSKMKPSIINKQNIQTLNELANTYNINYNKSTKKKELSTLINEYLQKNYFEPIDAPNASKLDLVIIGRNIQHNFDSIFNEEISTIDKVIIENQISPIANRMKTIQGMIAQYFIMRNNNIEIEFINASNKLKVGLIDKENDKDKNTVKDKSEKNTYSERKKLGIIKSIEYLNLPNFNEWETFFKNHSKKDDLADCLLQGLWFISSTFSK
jgi:hypothetical protein